MSSLFIIGNGFDLAHGLPSGYQDFKRFLSTYYPTAEDNCDLQFDIDNYLNTPEDDFSAQILFSAMNNACGPEWGNFENALGYMNFQKTFPRRSHEENEDQAMTDYLLAMDVISNLISKSTKYWQTFLSDWIRTVEHELDKGDHVPKPTLVSLFNKPDNLYLTFNYTKGLQKLYVTRGVVHIHNRVGQKLIFGHGIDKATYSEPCIDGALAASSLDEILASFRKDNITPMKKYKDFFNRINANTNNVYSYGFSYSKADILYIKLIISKISPNATWHFTKYEVDDKNGIRIKKLKLRRYGFTGTFGIFKG